MRILDGVALVLAVLLSLLLVYAAGVYAATAAVSVPAPSTEGRDAVAQRHLIKAGGARAADIVVAVSDESRGEPLAALLILLLKEGRGTR